MTATAAPPLGAIPPQAAVMAQARDENFPVALAVLGRRQRAALLAVYGYARLVDDIGDEAGGDRRALLDWVEAELDRVYAGERPQHEAIRALAAAVRDRSLPREPLQRLIEANRRDQEVTRYETFDELLDYCRLSAAPVGELVLHVFDAATPDRIALSDRVCAGLQVTEHITDVAEDLARGRLYMPAADMRRCGCREEDLRAPRAGVQARALIALELRRARVLLAAGVPLIRTLRGRAALAVAGYVAGGRAALAVVERASYDVLGARPRPSASDLAAALARTAAGR